MAKSAQVKRDLCVRRIAEIYAVAEAAKTSSMQKDILFACYSDVADIVEDFNHSHLKIIQEANTNFDEEDAHRARFDKMKYAIRATYYSLENADRSNASIQQASTSSKIRLPKISLPRFAGELALWPSFIALYDTSIHANDQLSDMEKYQYLLASLSGDALSVVKNLPLAPGHYSIAYDLLVSRYQNKRKLATHYWHSLVNAKALKADSADTLRKLLDTFNENIRALELMEFPTESWDFILLNTLLDKLTPSLREKFEAEHRKSEIPQYTQLVDFLQEYIQVFVAMSNPGKSGDKSTKNPGSQSASTVASFVTNTATCPVCQNSHGIGKCPSFLKLSATERHSKARELKLCFNCLRAGHRLNSCPSAWSCRTCRAKHHTLLHFERPSTPVASSTPHTSAAGSPPAAKNDTVKQENSSTVAMTSMSNSSPIIVLSTARAEIIDRHGQPLPVRLLLDCASQSNFITEGCVQRGGFPRTHSRGVVRAVNDTKAATTRGCTSFVIRVHHREDIRIPVTATILPRISSQLPNANVKARAWSHLQGLSLADPEYHTPGAIDILLGAEMFVSLLRDGHRKGGEGEPDAFNTIFGWVVMGAVSPAASQAVHSFVTVLDSIDETLNKFWQVEDIPECTPSREDQSCEQLFAQTTHRDESGRFVVSYPFVKEPPCFTDSRMIAIRRLRSLERRFRSDAEFKANYHQFMRDYLEQGHMELVPQPFPVDGRVNYLPHHGVIKVDSATTKLRVVFDASSRCSNGLSLNQTMLSGPKLQQDIMAILLGFRIGRVALSADVKQMFRQIWIDPAQRDYQRIVWRSSESEPIADYRLTTVTFGIAPSPYLAIRCLLQLAREGKASHPLAVAFILSALYVDDFVMSVQSIEVARELRKQLQELLESAGFELRKWASSHPAVLSDLDAELCSSAMLSFDSVDNQSLKILGLRWYSSIDSFGFQVNPLNRACTKRSILSELARIFDPLGFLTPLTFAAKRLIQRLWTLGLDWDDEPPAEICAQWESYRTELTTLADLRIPRSLDVDGVIRRELHGFCDASEQGYGAVVYMRIVTEDAVHVQLLAGKSKVAPLKPITLPRLELCAALLLSELLAYVHRSLKERIELPAIHAWSDSTITLYWIRSEPHRWKTFVRNRVAQIQTNLPIAIWGHVSTDSNPADPCSRGLTPLQLVSCRLWWHGPEWLRGSEPRVEPEYDSGDHLIEELTGSTFVVINDNFLFDSLLERRSSLDKICRIVAYVLRFRARTRLKAVPQTVAVDQVEAHSALLLLVKLVQRQCFSEDILALQGERGIPKELRKLAPFLDESGVLRVGGRIDRSSLSYEARHPALLPTHNRLTDLIVERTHQVHLHPGRRAMQYLLSQHFWIVGMQRAIKRVVSNCYQCFRAAPRPLQPYMAELPPERITQVKPFSIAGVDYAGPFLVTARRARGVTASKAYVCLFVCFAVKAVHLELAMSLSAESFLAALRRFVARRGRCSTLFSDCGTNFVGAHRELVGFMQQASESERIKWSFNPPSAPHFGGLWEAGVKSVKTHLKRVIGDQVLSAEEFSTVLAQIEAVLNSRPLCPMSSDPNDLEVLSPGHFLTLEPLVAVPSPDVTLLPTGRLDRWQFVQRMHQEFWKRWHVEYLHTLQQRPKWLKQTDPIREDALVLILDSNLPPLRWKRGRVERLHPGPDGISRVATVRTADGNLTRPLVKLCPLPSGNAPRAAL